MEAFLQHGTLPLVIEGPVESEAEDGQLDSMQLTVLVNAAITGGWRAAIASAGYARKTKLADGHSMWVNSLQSTANGPLAEVTVDAVGLLASTDKRRRMLGVAGREVAVGPNERVIIVEEGEGEDPVDAATETIRRRVPKVNSLGEVVYQTIITPSGSATRWNVREAFLTVTDRYFTTTAPSTTVIGTAQTPSNAPTPPSNPWGSYAGDMRAIHPNGWVLDDRQVTILFSQTSPTAAALYEVTDVFGYYLPAIPD
jgi:hypothetical protein